MKKITYIISDVDKAVAFEWIAESMDKTRFELSFILLNSGPSHLEDYLIKNKFQVFSIPCRGKKDWPKAILKTYSLLKNLQPTAVHCHLIQANIIGLTAAKLAGINSRIYTRHHSSLHHVYHPKGVIWDKLANRLSTKIIAISKLVKDILIDWEKADSGKVVIIPHGFKLDTFEQVEEDQKLAFKTKYQLAQKGPVIGVISRFTIWKGVQFIIPAFEKLLVDYPNAVLLLLNAKGDYEQEIKNELNDLPASSYRLIPFEKNITAAFKNLDVFIHVPVDEHSEAFGQIYVEALAAGVPSVFTLSGIAPDFIIDKYNALVVPFRNAEEIYQSMAWILFHEEERKLIIKNGAKDVAQKFSLEKMIHSLEELYERN